MFLNGKLNYVLWEHVKFFEKKSNGYKIPNCFPKIFKLVIVNSKMTIKKLEMN